MAGVNSVSNSAVFGSSYQKSQSDNMGQVDFMRLLVAQMRNQNPLEPQSNTEFMAQLAQFESLNQMRTMSQGIQVMQAMQELSSATGMIGKTITGRRWTPPLPPATSLAVKCSPAPTTASPR